MYWATRFVLVCLVVTQARCGNDSYGFIKRDIVIQCISNPINDVCPLGHKVPKRVFNIYPGIKAGVRRISARFRSAGGNDNCTEAVKMFECSRSIRTCKTDLSYFYLDSAKAYALCLDARQACAQVDKKLRDTWLDCNTIRSRGSSRQDRRQATCEKYPKLKNDICPVRNYKVVSGSAKALKSSFVQDQNNLKSFLREKNVGEKCSNDIFRVFCEYSAPACTRDEQFEVAFLSKQKCFKILKCLNAASNTEIFYRLNRYVSCYAFPDENRAKKISITKINNLTTPTSSNSNRTAYTITKYSNNTAYNITKYSNGVTKKMRVAIGKGSRLSAVGYILVVFIFWLFLDNFAE